MIDRIPSWLGGLWFLFFSGANRVGRHRHTHNLLCTCFCDMPNKCMTSLHVSFVPHRQREIARFLACFLLN